MGRRHPPVDLPVGIPTPMRCIHCSEVIGTLMSYQMLAGTRAYDDVVNTHLDSSPGCRMVSIHAQ